MGFEIDAICAGEGFGGQLKADKKSDLNSQPQHRLPALAPTASLLPV
jgi:hypothetical protein